MRPIGCGQKAAAERRKHLSNVSVIGIDLAKRVFQAQGAQCDGGVASRTESTPAELPTLLAARLTCVVAMEACARAHEWRCAIEGLGHHVRLIPPSYVKPCVKWKWT